MQIKCTRFLLAMATAFAVIWVAPPVFAEKEQNSEGVVAMVNGASVTRYAFDNGVNQLIKQKSARGKKVGDLQVAEIKKEVLDMLIKSELFYQASQKKGIKIEDSDVNQELENLKKRFPNEEEFKKALSKDNLSEDALNIQIKRNLAVQQFIEGSIVKNIKVSDKEIKAYYDEHPDFFKVPEQVKASHILIKFDPKADESQKAKAHKKIVEIQQKLEKGEDFAELAKESSQCPSNAKGGDLGYFRSGQMVKPFEETAFVLKPGEVSDIVETRFGYHIIKVFDKKPESTIKLENAKDKIEGYLKQEKVQQKVELYLEELKAKADIQRFITENPQ